MLENQTMGRRVMYSTPDSGYFLVVIILLRSLLPYFHAYPVNAQKLGAATTGSVWRPVKLPPIVSLGANRIGMLISNASQGREIVCTPQGFEAEAVELGWKIQACCYWRDSGR